MSVSFLDLCSLSLSRALMIEEGQPCSFVLAQSEFFPSLCPVKTYKKTSIVSFFSTSTPSQKGKKTSSLSLFCTLSSALSLFYSKDTTKHNPSLRALSKDCAKKQNTRRGERMENASLSLEEHWRLGLPRASLLRRALRCARDSGVQGCVEVPLGSINSRRRGHPSISNSNVASTCKSTFSARLRTSSDFCSPINAGTVRRPQPPRSRFRRDFIFASMQGTPFCGARYLHSCSRRRRRVSPVPRARPALRAAKKGCRSRRDSL